ncbi:MAG: class I tRNA ligase family protein, partial [Pedosphaera parvula]|nr:class I tRNA ligase family protein [Pedosphaera parvula]
YCDWFVEASKAALPRQVKELNELHGEGASAGSDVTMQPFNDVTNTALRANKLAVIDFVLSHMLRLFHPFLPFITEELWHGMGFHGDLPAEQGGDTIMFAHWPKPLDDDFNAHYGLSEADERFVEQKYELVGAGRNLRREFNIPANKKAKFVLKPATELPAHETAVLRILLNAEPLEVDPNFVPPKGTPTVRSPLGELSLPLEGLIDLAAEKARLQKERTKIEAEIDKAQQKLNNPAFTAKAPAHVLEEQRKRLADWHEKRQHVESALKNLEG